MPSPAPAGPGRSKDTAGSDATRASTSTPESAVKFTRAAALWSALIVGFLILIVLLVFIMQNTDSATIHFFGWEWNLPVGVAILLAAVCGGLLTSRPAPPASSSCAARRRRTSRPGLLYAEASSALSPSAISGPTA